MEVEWGNRNVGMCRLYVFLSIKNRHLHQISTPDNRKILIEIVSKNQSDSLEHAFLGNKIHNHYQESHHRFAYKIDKGQILYRQFFKSIGFIFPDEANFQMAVRSESYYEVNLQPTDNFSNYGVKEEKFTRVAAAFSLYPTYANKIKSNIQSRVENYESFEGYQFYYLSDSSVLMLKPRTSELSDGYWFGSLRDFDYFFWIFSGQNRPKHST